MNNTLSTIASIASSFQFEYFEHCFTANEIKVLDRMYANTKIAKEQARTNKFDAQAYDFEIDDSILDSDEKRRSYKMLSDHNNMIERIKLLAK